MISLLAIIVSPVLVASALLWRAVLELPRASARLSALFRDALRNDAITFDSALRRRTAPNGTRHRRAPSRSPEPRLTGSWIAAMMTRSSAETVRDKQGEGERREPDGGPQDPSVARVLSDCPPGLDSIVQCGSAHETHAIPAPQSRKSRRRAPDAVATAVPPARSSLSLVVAAATAGALILLACALVYPIQIDLSSAALATIVAGAVAGAIVSGMAGFAFSPVAGGLILHVLPPAAALPLLLWCSLLNQIIGIVALRHSIRWRQNLRFIAVGLLGAPLGVEAALLIDPRVFGIGFGLLLIAYSLYMLAHPFVGTVRYDRLGAQVAVGFLGGVAGGLTDLGQ